MSDDDREVAAREVAAREVAAREVAVEFIRAVLWGEHLTVWKLLSTAGRDHVLSAGERRGLDAVQAQRIRQGTSTDQEMDTFLTGLIHGLRFDFSSVELSEVRVGSDVVREGEAGLEIEFGLEVPATFGDQWWAAGSIVVAHTDSGWRVERIHPLVSRSE